MLRPRNCFVLRVLGIRLLERRRLARLLAAQRLVQLGQRSLFAEAEVAAAGLGVDAVARRGHLDHGEIAVFETAIVYGPIRAGLIAKALDHAADVGLGDVDLRIVDRQPAILAELELRLHFEFGLVLDRRAFDERVHVLQMRLADDLDAFVGDGVVERARQQPLHHLLLDLFGEAGAHDAERHFAGRNPGMLAWRLKSAVTRCDSAEMRSAGISTSTIFLTGETSS